MIEDGSRIRAVAEINEVDVVSEAYAREYRDRYGVEPIWSFDGSDATIVKDLIRKVGAAKAKQLLRAYVRMDDEWFVERGHNLETFKKNIARVNAFLGTKLEQASANKRIVMRILLSCDSCFKDFYWEGTAHELEGPRLCEGCK